MTSTEAMSERDSTGSTDGMPGPSWAASVAVRAHILVASLFLLAGLGALGLAAAKLVWPDLLDDTAALTFGRVQPMAINLLVFGWLTVALSGVAYHVVPRAVGAPLAFPLGALANLVLMAGGTAAGVAGIAAGRADGPRLSAMPFEARGALLVSFLVTAVLLARTARRGDRGSLPLSAWYLVAAPWWLFASQALGWLPDASGLPADIQTHYAASAVIGLWVAAAGIGGGYHLVARLVPGARFNPDLGRIAFWSLAFVWVWTAGASLQYGPTRDWFETLPVVFSAGLLLVVVTVIADFAGALRGRRHALRSLPAVRLYLAGLVLFALVPLHVFAQSLRSVSAVVRFTEFEAAFDLLAPAGAMTLWAMALGLFALGVGEREGRGSALATSAVLWSVFAGVAIAAGSRMVAGLQQGLAWLAEVQEGDRANFGEGFRPSVEGLAGSHQAQVFGIGLMLLGAVVFALWALTRSVRRTAEEGEGEAAPLATHRLAAVLRGAVLVFAVGALGAYAIPAMDADAEPSLLADRSRSFEEGSLGDVGRGLYLTEGCMYCHTQEVRVIVTDVGLGPVSVAGDYAFDPAGISGIRRIGPDLAHAGSRDPTDSARWVRDHLVDPRAARPWSTMPSYRYLNEDQLTALAVYVAGLE